MRIAIKTANIKNTPLISDAVKNRVQNSLLAYNKRIKTTFFKCLCVTLFGYAI